MKKTALAVLVVLALALGFGASSASAGVLGNHIDLPGLHFGLDSYQQSDGSTTFSSSLSTLDQIENAYVSFSKDSSDPLQGWISINFSGVVGTPVTQKEWQNSSMHIGYRGLMADTNVGIGAYQEIIGWISKGDGGDPIYGNWMSEGSGSVTLSGVTLLGSTGGYDEYTYVAGDGGKGFAAGSWEYYTGFNAYAQFQVKFDSQMAADVYSGMGTTSMQVTPEPATMALLGLGGIVTLVRRYRRRQ